MDILAQARETEQSARERFAPGSLNFNGRVYSGGGLYLGPYREEQNDAGNWKPAQRMTILIRKSLMATPPAKREKITCSGHTWKVDDVAGQSPTSIAWIIKGIRWPATPS